MMIVRPYFLLASLSLSLASVDQLSAQSKGKPDPTSATRSAMIDAANYPSLQAAFDAVPVSGGVVRIPPGDYPISEPLILARGETRIEGAGSATKIINLNQKGQPALIVRHPNWPTDKKSKLWRVQLADFRVCGDPDAVDGKSTKPTGGDGILCEGIQELYLSGMSVDHHGGQGVNLVDCYEDPRICDSIFTYNRAAGIHILNGHDIVVNANHFEENQDALRCIDSFNLCLNGNNVDDHLGNGIIIENTYGSVLSGNMIEECDGTAVILDRDCYGITLSANVIAHHQTGGIDLRDAWGCTIAANTFVLVNKFSLKIGPNSGRITVTGNTYTNSHIGGTTKRPIEDPRPIAQDLAYGMLLDSTADIAITGNVFSGLRNPAITTLGPCQRIVVVGNIISEVDTDSKSPQNFAKSPETTWSESANSLMPAP